MSTDTDINRGTGHWFKTGKKILNVHGQPINDATWGAIEATQTAATKAVLASTSERIRGADLIAVTEASLVGGKAAVVTLLEQLSEFSAGCLGQELRDLLAVARAQAEERA